MEIQKRFDWTWLAIYTSLIIVVCFLIIPSAICVERPRPAAPQHPLPGIPTQANTDGYNYYRYKDGVTDFVYNQLWFFSFLDDRGDTDPSNDLAGVAAFGLANPENLFGQQGVTVSFGMIIRDPSEGKSFNAYSPQWDPAVPGNFLASETFEPGPGYELENPGGHIDVITEDEYHVVGQVIEAGREIRWDLTYTRGPGPGWLPWVEWPLPATMGIFPAWITYHMHMPNAVVNGTFYVKDSADEVTYALTNATGYHDGFYSKFVFSIIEWDWLDYKQSDPDISVHLLHPHAPMYTCEEGWSPCTPGNLRIFYNGTVYDFVRHRDTIEISYDMTAHDPEYNVDYPTEETIIAEDTAGNQLNLHWTLIRFLKVYFDVPDPFKDTVTFEIVAEFSGTFYEASTGTTVPIYGTGWADWSGPAFPES